eukprot:4999686-Pyramimonas_sp.AAC.1
MCNTRLMQHPWQLSRMGESPGWDAPGWEQLRMTSIMEMRDKAELFVFFLQLDGFFAEPLSFYDRLVKLSGRGEFKTRFVAEGGLNSYVCAGMDDRLFVTSAIRSVASGVTLGSAAGNYSEAIFDQHEDEVRGNRR